MLMPSVASASNMSAATPGCDFIPAPTNEIFAMSSSTVNPAAPISAVSASRARLQRSRSHRGERIEGLLQALAIGPRRGERHVGLRLVRHVLDDHVDVDGLRCDRLEDAR